MSPTALQTPRPLALIETAGFPDYRLLDSGAGRKLERFGAITVNRPEPQALWRPKLAEAQWAKAHAVFSASGEDDEKGRWRVDRAVPESWPLKLAIDPRFSATPTVLCKLQGLWHLGLFPEQAPHWSWMLDRIGSSPKMSEPPRVLNLFGYTGAASLLAAAMGADVTHCDASKKAIAWGRENQNASRMAEAKIRWIVDDAQKFVAREVRRGRKYEMILVDPPKFGRGPDGEVWDLFADLPQMLAECAKLLDDQRSAMILTVYAIRASSLAFDQLMREKLEGRGGQFETGELAIRADGGHAVPTSLFTRWTSGP